MQEIIDKYPQLLDIDSDSINSIFKSIIGEDYNPNLSFHDQGFDELDGVEFIMYIEKLLNIYIYIPDDIGDKIISGEINLWSLALINSRDSKIKSILND